jgi:hypothetical protein
VISLLLSLLIAVSPNCIVRTPHGIPVRGVASWYDATRNNAWYTRQGNRLYGAVGTFRWGDDPYGVKVCRADDPTDCVVVLITDYCGRCHQDLKRPWSDRSRSIDLSPQAFVQLRGLHMGVVEVIITEYNGGGR